MIGYPEKYEAQDLIEFVEARHGWAVREQAEGILLNAESLDDQNPEALRLIAGVFRLKGEVELAQEIFDYLKTLEEEMSK